MAEINKLQDKLIRFNKLSVLYSDVISKCSKELGIQPIVGPNVFPNRMERIKDTRGIEIAIEVGTQEIQLLTNMLYINKNY